MKAFSSKLDAATMQARSAHGQAKLDAIRRLEAKVEEASSAKRDKFEARGQLLPRARIRALLDPDAAFLELNRLAGWNMHDDEGDRVVTGGGSIVGLGIVRGVRVVVAANDSGIKGGTVTPMGLEKMLRAQEIALRQRLPLVYLVESGGANLLYQAEIFVKGGRSFANQARLSAAGIPQIAVVHGSSTAGGAYLPGLSDYVVLVNNRSKVFLAGPPLVKAALGEESTDEELGGAKLHAETTGLGEYLAKDDAEALAIARDLFGALRWDRVEPRAEASPPRHPASELLGLVPESERTPLDVREVLLRVCDDSHFVPFKERYGRETVCAHARIAGHAVGILGNNGPIQPNGSTKATQFIQLCDQTQTPLVFLQNTTGYMVGKTAEAGGAIKHGAKMIQAVANARVPKLTVVIGGSYGAGNYGMCGRGFDPDFIFSWPTARVAVMGPNQAAEVMKTITRAKLEKAGQSVDDDALDAMAGGVRQQLERESTALFATARLWDDGIIDPRDTRAVLALALDVTERGRARALAPNTFGVARP